MILEKYTLTSSTMTPFQAYLLNSPDVKKLCREFDFYGVLFYKEELTKTLFEVSLRYPKGNLYWYEDFRKYVETKLFTECDASYEKDWLMLLSELKKRVRMEAATLKGELNGITAAQIVLMQQIYLLRDYQALDLEQLKIKYKYWNNRGLILSAPRTGKTRVALAALDQLAEEGTVALIVCPKTAEMGWENEIKLLKRNGALDRFTDCNMRIHGTAMIRNCSTADVSVGITPRIISYELFRTLTITQLRQLTTKCKKVMLICDEMHRLRNFSTLQSKALFDFKEFCVKDKVSLGIIGLTATPAVKDTSDVFGSLCLINDSKIQFRPYYNCFDCFKEYFYYCEDTSFGKKAKALRREHELKFVLQSCSVQTKQQDLPMFQNYTKKYIKVTLQMDAEQKKIYDSVYNDMEYDEDIDCQNKLVQLTRLQQICIDPYGLVPAYEGLSPKMKWVVGFAKKNDMKFIVACKKTTPLNHLKDVLSKHGIKHVGISGDCSYAKRVDAMNAFSLDPEVKVMLLQLDTGREALTLPAARATVFLDRDFAQGFNEQAEARMTPVDGSKCTKYIIDLVMMNSKEEMIYETLVDKKESIDAVNTVFKRKDI